MQQGVPWLVETPNGEEGVRMVPWLLVSFGQDMIREDPELVVNMVSTLDKKLYDDGCPNETSDPTSPVSGLPDKQIAQ